MERSGRVLWVPTRPNLAQLSVRWRLRAILLPSMEGLLQAGRREYRPVKQAHLQPAWATRIVRLRLLVATQRWQMVQLLPTGPLKRFYVRAAPTRQREARVAPASLQAHLPLLHKVAALL